MSRVLAIVNPAAGRKATARAWSRVRPLYDWDWVQTEWPGHARELAANAAGVYERVVVVGGDGTASEVANGLAHSQTSMAVIPAGTGNDLAVNLGIPADPVAAAELAATGHAYPIDLGEIQRPTRTSYFIDIAGFGFDAEVAARVNRLPKWGGRTLPYLAGVLQTLWQFRSPGMRLTLDSTVIDEPIFLTAVANCATYGGGMRIAPTASPDDGLFEVCVVRDLGRLEVLRMLPRLYSGGHVGHRAVEIIRCASLSAAASARVLCQADGELDGELPVQFAIRPAALLCVRPRRPTQAPAAQP